MYNYAFVHKYYNICCLLLLYIVFSTFRTQYILHVCIIRFKLCVSSFLKLNKLCYTTVLYKKREENHSETSLFIYVSNDFTNIII